MKKLMKGNEAIAEAAIQAGCRYFFGYPITPQNQIPEYMSKRMPQVQGCFLQAESEVAAINMVYGAGGAGARVMTSSSSPGISLKQEGISYLVGAEVPCVIVNMVRGGPGLGSIQPAQSDYFQSTRGGGHGDYRMCVLAPGSVQEAVDLTQDAFDIADRYRNPVLVLGDGLIGQMMEPVDMEKATAYRPAENLPAKDWAANGHRPTEQAPRAIINSLFIDPQVLEAHGLALQAKYDEIARQECRWQEELLEDAQIVLVAYGTTSRIARSAMRRCRARGIKVGMVRPITLWPYPEAALRKTIPTAKAYLVVEMSMGQMVDDVRLAINGERPVHFYGRAGGMVPTVADVVAQIEILAGVEPIPPEICQVNVKSTLNDAAQKADEVAKAMSEKFNEFGQKINEALNNPEVSQKAEAAMGKVDAAMDTVGQKMDEASRKLTDALQSDGFRENAEAAIGKVQEAMGLMGQKLDEAGRKLTDALQSEELKEKAAAAAHTAEDWASTLGAKISQAFDGAGQQADAAASAAQDAVQKAAQDAAPVVENALDAAGEGVQKAADAAEKAADAAAVTAAQAAEQAKAAAGEAAKTAGETLEGVIGTIGSTLDAAGKKIVELVDSGDLKEKADEATQKAGEFAKNAAQTVKKSAGGLFGAIGKLFEGVKKDLKDIEAEQAAGKSPDDTQGKEGN